MPSATGWSANNAASPARPRALDDPLLMRRAGRELLSLALIDARNQVLRLLALDSGADALRLAARAGWYQEYWIARHMQRQRGEACDARAPRLAGIDLRADSWAAAGAALPPPDTLRAYLQETLEITLELLAALPAALADDDQALFFYRAALLHEDRITEALCERLLLGAPPALTGAASLWLPAQRWQLGACAHDAPGLAQGMAPGLTHGLVPHNERGALTVDLPEFEIDARPVNWGAYAEFAGDGAYDRRTLWCDAGWAWLQAEGRRAPRHVEQLVGGVLVLRDGGLQRAPAAQPVLHVSRYEAEAWCRWAGRRLPAEVEWEVAACSGAARGFVWGQVLEWVAGSARLWPGAGAAPPGSVDSPAAVDAADAVDAAAPSAVLRGASFATRLRQHHPRGRRFVAAAQDTMFCGFRSCAL